MRNTYAAILICAAASLGLGFAQNAGDDRKAPPPEPLCSHPAYNPPITKPKDPNKDPNYVICPPLPLTKDNTGNIADDTKAALACEWAETTGVRHVLEALRYYTIPALTRGEFRPIEAKKNALLQLVKGDPNPIDEGLYRAAQGDPDEDGQPRAQGLPDFLDDLAKANTLKQKKPDNEDQLFEDAKQRIGKIFATSTGPQKLIRINDSFGQDSHVGLYELLKAYPGYDANSEHPATQDYACSLEVLRAAYEMKPDRLIELVTDEITGSKK